MITRLDSKLGNINIFGDHTDQHCRIFCSQFLRLWTRLYGQFIILGESNYTLHWTLTDKKVYVFLYLNTLDR